MLYANCVFQNEPRSLSPDFVEGHLLHNPNFKYLEPHHNGPPKNSLITPTNNTTEYKEKTNAPLLFGTILTLKTSPNEYTLQLIIYKSLAGADRPDKILNLRGTRF